ncbi:glycosyl hydrolase [Alkalinema pantanalense CENA528]|uniref:glycosyl hydrolase n=1 Tax=Alkalinema pantanalense TaxID=1620705 RepID=UPI003D6DCC83
MQMRWVWKAWSRWAIAGFLVLGLGTACNASLLGRSPASSPPPPSKLASVMLTAKSGEQQKFGGFGVSQIVSKDYAQLPYGRRKELSQVLWKDLRLNTLRLWFFMDVYAPKPGQRQLRPMFTEPYLQMVRDAQQTGQLQNLLLAPTGVPQYLLEKRDGGMRIRPDKLVDWAETIANFIQEVRDRYGIQINVTGIQNEPNDDHVNFSKGEIAQAVKQLRRSLDQRKLNAVKIIAPESSNADGYAERLIDDLKQDPDAWNAIEGIATHSYNMAATPAMVDRVRNTGKTYWQTEAGANGPEEPGNAMIATSMAARFLNDVNHWVTHWIWFIGAAQADPNDNATRLMKYEADRPQRTWLTRFKKYDYLQQLSQTFEVGATFRTVESSLDGKMVWTYGKKPRINAAVARNPDGSWAIGITNFTSEEGRHSQDPHDQTGYPRQTFSVTLKINELIGGSPTRLQVRRSNAQLSNQEQAEIMLRNGVVTLDIQPLELVTLRSRP